MYFAGAVPYLRLKREGGALPYFTGAQLYLSGAETVEYSLVKLQMLGDGAYRLDVK